ncbi:hypothetical protein ACI2K4_00625 [Micromonospora sp. NPDC050397]|uniref:hypothetical protein n=1 Tax=Micromonospora sp. NPDC050397 TaxID=3364279 RepID=UPI003850762D
MSCLYLLAGLLLVVSTGYQLASDGVAVVPVVGLLAALAMIVVAAIGLVAPPRER